MAMSTKGATVAPEKRYKYYGQEYKKPVKVMAEMARVSVRYMKYVLQLQGMGYQSRIDAGWTMKQCFDHAGMERKRRKATSMADMDDAVYEIKRLRGMLFDLGVDPDG